ncbi:HIT family protein [Vibrio vulnificus]|uniref:HIT family protein n=1 Tax=Vibrio vulnificus TaxID=672 RepID=UPI0032421CED
MATEQTCIICQIQQNKLTHFLIAEREGFKAVLDKYPIAEGHILILSPSHASHLEQLSDSEYATLFQFARDIGQQMSHVYDGVCDYNVIINNGQYSGQHIPHVHLHLIPRKKGDTVHFYWRLLTRFINPLSPMNTLARLKCVHQKWQQRISIVDSSKS